MKRPGRVEGYHCYEVSFTKDDSKGEIIIKT